MLNEVLAETIIYFVTQLHLITSTVPFQTSHLFVAHHFSNTPIQLLLPNTPIQLTLQTQVLLFQYTTKINRITHMYPL